jgi:predicted RNA-binding protein associated with RNAse of E/G family
MNIVDQDLLNKRVKEGVFTDALAQRALREAENVIKQYGGEEL